MTDTQKRGGFVRMPVVMNNAPVSGGCCGTSVANVNQPGTQGIDLKNAAVSGGCCGETVNQDAGSTGCCGEPSEVSGCCGEAKVI